LVLTSIAGIRRRIGDATNWGPEVGLEPPDVLGVVEVGGAEASGLLPVEDVLGEGMLVCVGAGEAEADGDVEKSGRTPTDSGFASSATCHCSTPI
jgi:hypothetical protein